jgi:hypothetical protein
MYAAHCCIVSRSAKRRTTGLNLTECAVLLIARTAAGTCTAAASRHGWSIASHTPMARARRPHATYASVQYTPTSLRRSSRSSQQTSSALTHSHSLTHSLTHAHTHSATAALAVATPSQSNRSIEIDRIRRLPPVLVVQLACSRCALQCQSTVPLRRSCAVCAARVAYAASCVSACPFLSCAVVPCVRKGTPLHRTCDHSDTNGHLLVWVHCMVRTRAGHSVWASTSRSR